MALGDPYVDLARLKDYLKIKPDKIEQDDNLNDAILSASGEIEKHCNRQFQRVEAASARVFRPEGCGTEVKVDDFWSTTGLVVEMDTAGDGAFSTVVPSSDYELYPVNGVVDGQAGWPYYEIHLVNGYFPVGGRRSNTVRVTAKWGWQSVPEPVRQACVIIAAETFQLKDAPFGTAGMDQFGNIYHVRDNRIAAGKLARYCRRRIPVG
jgi:hypothetical protein